MNVVGTQRLTISSSGGPNPNGRVYILGLPCLLVSPTLHSYCYHLVLHLAHFRYAGFYFHLLFALRQHEAPWRSPYTQVRPQHLVPHLLHLVIFNVFLLLLAVEVEVEVVVGVVDGVCPRGRPCLLALAREAGVEDVIEESLLQVFSSKIFVVGKDERSRSRTLCVVSAYAISDRKWVSRLLTSQCECLLLTLKTTTPVCSYLSAM